ncbi:F0F1 ATP synthase subunit B family protein [Hippea jasoniae]|uniref:F0F1 ATP synthase subunit B family protein n=1 Tax=Hippea jasoniae TaxID=944479 RepID=UPI00055659A3|nr:ATP synthase F0 subunit B [Hippea jasoniae]
MFKFILSLMFVFVPVLVFGADESGIEPNMGWRMINFAIFVVVLWYFLRKPIVNYFKGRRESIVNELKEAESLKEEAEKLLKEAEEKINSLEEELKKIIETFESMAESEKQQIFKELEETLARIKASIEEEKNSILSRAKLELLRKMSKDAIENLKRKIAQLSENEHRKINEKFIRSLQQ